MRLIPIAVALMALQAFATTAKAQDGDDSTVYVDSNIATPNGNSVFAFTRSSSGALTPMPGSPFLTRGRGVSDPSLQLGPFDSAHEIILSPDKHRLFAVNSGSNTIAVMNVHEDGSLSHVEGSPFPSGGVDPVSVGFINGYLAVVNKDNGPSKPITAAKPNYVLFNILEDGKLVKVPQSVIHLPGGASPTEALIAPNDRFIFGADFLGGKLQSLVLQNDGSLLQHIPLDLPVSEFPDPTTPRLPLGLEVQPLAKVLYVGFVTANKLGVYTYSDNGKLHFEKTVPNSGIAICWLAISHSGRRLYTANTGDNSVSVYTTTNPLFPGEIQKLTLKGVGSAFQLELDPTGHFLYVVGERATPTVPLGQGNVLHVLRVDQEDGTLEEVASSPTTLPAPLGTRSQGVAST